LICVSTLPATVINPVLMLCSLCCDGSFGD
jgi:hypothetical protein